ETEKEGFDWSLLIPVAFIAFFIFIVGAVIYTVRKKPYQKPILKMESLGVRRGLTAVEAGYSIDMPPEKVVTMILYSLLRKRAVWVKEVKPSVKLEVMDDFKDFTGKSSETPLRYYEIDFLRSMKSD
ncbi:MAG: hypothetical protein GTN76_09160, partial [Candidatus Aenigmarchaeota archaeon]|nr:hypothetical protein [Candidatus Aenigmarchaeota archaeon]